MNSFMYDITMLRQYTNIREKTTFNQNRPLACRVYMGGIWYQL